MAERDDDLTQLEDAYRHYRAAQPPQPPPPRAWAPLGTLIAAQPARSRRALWWFAGLAAAACLAWAVLSIPRASHDPESLLARATEPPPARTIAFTFRGRKILRPAVLASDDSGNSPLGALFLRANYSWQEPLSPRSFQRWRRSLSTRTDRVTRRDRSGERCFDIQTETPEGILGGVTLTLRAVDLSPTSGRFSFRGEAVVDSELVDAPVATPTRSRAANSAPAPAEVEPATPEDTLRVFAALNSIGADSGEPVEVVDDAGHRNVRVLAGSLPAERQRQVREVLAPLPRVVLDVASPAAVFSVREASPEPAASHIPGSIRRLLEQRLGGPVRVQEVTDDVLETSSLLLARAHAYDVLVRRFPPALEPGLSPTARATLARLQQAHLSTALALLGRIRTLLGPLRVAGPPDTTPSWTALAAETDRDLNQLLAGTYTAAQGDALLRRIPARLDRLETLLRGEAR